MFIALSIFILLAMSIINLISIADVFEGDQQSTSSRRDKGDNPFLK